jgi:hypothetical protein
MDVGLLMGGPLAAKSVRHAFEAMEKIRRAKAAERPSDRA